MKPSEPVLTAHGAARSRHSQATPAGPFANRLHEGGGTPGNMPRFTYDGGMLEQRIQQHFFDAADLNYQVAELLARPILHATDALLGAITSGGKVFVGGVGAAAALAEVLTTHLAGQMERERPALPVLSLGGAASFLSASASSSGGPDCWSRSLQALGQPGDLLVLLDAGADPVPLAVAIDSAREKDMAVLLLCGRSAPGLVERLLDTDVLISVPHDRPARILEMQLLVIHALCDGLDALLLGEEESE